MSELVERVPMPGDNRRFGRAAELVHRALALDALSPAARALEEKAILRDLHALDRTRGLAASPPGTIPYSCRQCGNSGWIEEPAVPGSVIRCYECKAIVVDQSATAPAG